MLQILFCFEVVTLFKSGFSLSDTDYLDDNYDSRTSCDYEGDVSCKTACEICFGIPGPIIVSDQYNIDVITISVQSNSSIQMLSLVDTAIPIGRPAHKI